MAVLRKVAMIRGRVPVRTWERSSSQVTFLTQWSRLYESARGAVSSFLTVRYAGELGPAPQGRQVDDLAGPGCPAAVASSGRARTDRDRARREVLEHRQELWVVSLDGEDVVRAGIEDGLSGVVLGMHRIQGDHASVQVSGIEPGQQITHRVDLVQLWPRLDVEPGPRRWCDRGQR